MFDKGNQLAAFSPNRNSKILNIEETLYSLKKQNF